MNPELEAVSSIINGNHFAKDKDRVFTFIEFIKMFGYQNDPNIFITYYKDYLTRWAAVKKQEISISDEDFVFSKLVDILKSITLDYSSYEEQDFIAHINLNNKSHLKALTALYSRKIREITEFYRKKRNESVLVVNRNSIKGSKKSIQEIIYNKVFDFIFSNKNIVPSYKNIKRDLLVTVEQYVDTYSEYFDIPRTYEFTDETRREMLTANMNDVDYRVYLEIQLVISELLYSGNVMLEEIPLIAQLGLDLSQSCVGDMLALKNSLMANTTINRVDLDEQVALKRKLYEKYLGCDLWYMYVDLQKNIKIDLLCKAKNPTGNLLNCGNPDTATIPSEQEELLSHIGLFFKPDKTSILKINAKDYTWTIDTNNIIEDTVYIFPDPNSYGDIGNNKDNNYPLIMEYKLDWDIRNLSSGTSVDDPLMFITDQGWRSYYSKQDDIFKHTKNINWEYSFTQLTNRGFISNYQKDVWGNEFGLLKGYELSKTTKEVENEQGIIETKEVPKITLYGHGYKNEMIYGYNDEQQSNAKILNGGYFENPLYKGEEKNINGKPIWTYKGEENKTQPFNFDKRLIVTDNYLWSGLETHGINLQKEQLEFSTSVYDDNYINFGRFGDTENIEYEDHFGIVPNKYEGIVDNDQVIIDLMQQFLSVNLLEYPDKSDIVYEVKEVSYEELKTRQGELFVKLVSDIESAPFKITRETFDPNRAIPDYDWFDDEYEWNDFLIFGDIMVFDDKDAIRFLPYQYDGKTISGSLGNRRLLYIPKSNADATKILFNETERVFYILQLEKWNINTNKILMLPKIYKFDIKAYELKQIINPFDLAYKRKYEENKLDTYDYSYFIDYMDKKNEIIGNGQLLKDKLTSSSPKFLNILDFEIPQYDDNKLGEVIFSYNSTIGTYLISYVIIDENGTPYIFEYKFKITSNEDFESSLKTNVYTLKQLENESDIYWVKNTSLTPTYPSETSSYPDDAISGIKKIFGSSEIRYYSYNFSKEYTVDFSYNA